MNINDYLIDQEGINFDSVFEDWSEFLPSSFTVWLINRFGDMFLVLDDGSVSMLDVGIGSIRQIAPNKDAFCQFIDEDNNASELLMIPLVDELVKAGMTLAKDQCYSFKSRPPLLGGAYSVDNSTVCNIYVHYSLLGQIATQSKDLPDGTKIAKIEIKK